MRTERMAGGSERGQAAEMGVERKCAERTVCGSGWGWVCLGVCVGVVGCGERKEFARLCICRKGERVWVAWGYVSVVAVK